MMLLIEEQGSEGQHRSSWSARHDVMSIVNSGDGEARSYSVKLDSTRSSQKLTTWDLVLWLYAFLCTTSARHNKGAAL